MIKVYEAYSDTFPDWFVRAINKNRSLKDALIKSGVDLSNTEFIPDQVVSNRDPKLKDDTIFNVFKMADGSVGVKGDKWILDPYIYLPRNKITTNISKLSWKSILDNAIEYGHLIRHDPDVIQKRADRKIAKSGSVDRGKGQEHVQMFDYNYDEDSWTTKKIPAGWKWVMTKGQDKSGYPIDHDKYKRMLDNVGLDNYADRLENYYNKIERKRAQLVKNINDITLDKAMTTKSGWGSIYDQVSDAVRALDSAIGAYNRLSEACDEVINSEEIDDPRYDKNRRISHMFQFYGGTLRQNIDRLTEEIADLEKDMQ